MSDDFVAGTFGNRIIRFAANTHAPLSNLGTGVGGAALGKFNSSTDIAFALDKIALV